MYILYLIPSGCRWKLYDPSTPLGSCFQFSSLSCFSHPWPNSSELGARRMDGRVVLWVSLDVDVVCNPFLQWDWHWCCFSVIQRGPAMLKFENLRFYRHEKLIFSVFGFDETNWVLHSLHILNREEHHAAWLTSYISYISWIDKSIM